MKAKDPLKQMREWLRQENLKYPRELAPVEQDKWPTPHPAENKSDRTRVWRSRVFLVQEFISKPAINDYEEFNTVRLSINRTDMLRDNRWVDGITWDQIQEIKKQVGYGDQLAVEVYPPESKLVNEANIRHIWILPPEYKTFAFDVWND